MKTQEVLDMVSAEREYQAAKWWPNNPHTNEEWTIIASEEAGEVARAIMELWRNPTSKGNQLSLLQELVQQAAVLAAWIEDIASKSPAAVDMQQYSHLRRVQAASLTNQRIGRYVVQPPTDAANANTESE